MKKLKLELDELAVESFAPGTDTGEGGGTVHGREMAPTRSCPSVDLCPTDLCLTPWCPTNSTTLCRC
jgi:hypothetical protein